MGTRINHVAIVSDAYAMAQQFYQAVFGFRPPSVQKNFTAATVGDGYVGININPRRPARPAEVGSWETSARLFAYWVVSWATEGMIVRRAAA